MINIICVLIIILFILTFGLGVIVSYLFLSPKISENSLAYADFEKDLREFEDRN